MMIEQIEHIFSLGKGESWVGLESVEGSGGRGDSEKASIGKGLVSSVSFASF